jgi:hypothetical protein
VQSMLLSKALKIQQDLEDKKHEVIIENLESKIKDQSAALENSPSQKASNKKSRSLMQNLRPSSRKVQI